MTARVVAVVQARMSSRRLPGKALMELGGVSALELMLRRASRAHEPAELVVATSLEATDDAIAARVERLGLRAIRGSLRDVLDRYRQAAETTGANAVVRLTGDCPLVDPALIDHVVRLWRASGADYVSNGLEPRTFPDGMDVEVIPRAALEAAAAEATEPEDREHVTTFISSRPDRFRHERLDLDPPLGDMRVTLDRPADLELLRGLVDRHGPDLTLADLAGRPVRMVP